jgi:CheY-like chemotaxis protein
VAATGQAVPRHLVFVLDTDEVVVQKGANLVEVLETHEQRVFNDFERDHDVTDDELRGLVGENVIVGFDEMTVWLAPIVPSKLVSYFYLDTKLAPGYEQVINDLLGTAALGHRYTAKSRMGRVAILGRAGEPFGSLPDAESALTLVRQALSSYIADLSIETVRVNPTMEDSQIKTPENFADLIRETPVTTLADYSILIVEDEPELADNVRLALETLGVDVRVANTGEIALEILMDEEPDLVIIDLMLPDMHGYEVIAKIRKDPLMADTPVLVMSNHISEADVVFALHVAKADDYMVKPIGPNVLRHRVVNLLNRRI